MSGDPMVVAIRALQAFADKSSWFCGEYDETGAHQEFHNLDQDNLAVRAIRLMKEAMTSEQLERYFGYVHQDNT